MGKWVMKQKLFLFISFSSQVRVHVRPVDGFVTRDSSKDVKSRKDVLLGV